MVGGGDEAERERESPGRTTFQWVRVTLPERSSARGRFGLLSGCLQARERERESPITNGGPMRLRGLTRLSSPAEEERIFIIMRRTMYIYIYISEIQTPSHVDMRSMITGNNFYQSHMTCRTRFTGRAVVVDVKGQFGITCAEDDLDVTCLDFTLHWHTCQNSRRLRGRRPSPET